MSGLTMEFGPATDAPDIKKHYGAVGDGTTDDSAKIQQAIDACHDAGAGEVTIPGNLAGYGIGSPIKMRSNVELVGRGRRASILRKLSNMDAATPVLDYSGTSNAVSDRCQFAGGRNFMIDGGGRTGPLIKARFTDHLKLKYVLLANNNGPGFTPENCWDTTLVEVDFEWCSGSDGFGPCVLIGSNSGDSSNIITLRDCRFEAFTDGAVWLSSGPMQNPYTVATGPNPVYGVRLLNCKYETQNLRGPIVDASADVRTMHVIGGYVAARGLAPGISTGRTLFNIISASDFKVEHVRIRVDDTANSGKPTANDVFRCFTNGPGMALRHNMLDILKNPTTAVFNLAGGNGANFDISDNPTEFGQNPTMFSGAWPA